MAIDLFTMIFAMSRNAGWAAHALEGYDCVLTLQHVMTGALDVKIGKKAKGSKPSNDKVASTLTSYIGLCRMSLCSLPDP